MYANDNTRSPNPDRYVLISVTAVLSVDTNARCDTQPYEGEAVGALVKDFRQRLSQCLSQRLSQSVGVEALGEAIRPVRPARPVGPQAGVSVGQVALA
jgi:hypothetical protein